MKKFSEQLHKQSTTVKLQVAEKRELRERLVSYMEYHPLPAAMKSTQVEKKAKAIKSPIYADAFATFSIPFQAFFKYSAVAAALILVVVPFVAEKAVPGDSLYAIKVQFNEELRSTLTFSSYEKVEWETERLNRRIAEARLLASEGRLTEETEAEVAEAVRTHTENAKREIEELRTEDADEAALASIALDTTLEVQSTSLKNDVNDEVTGEATTMNDRPINLIAEAIDESRGPAEDYGASSTLPAFEKLMARVELNTTRVYELLDTVKEVAPAEKLAEVTRRLEDIERSIQVAVELSGEEGNGAQLQLVNVLQRTQRLIVYMTELQVTETVDIEILVPVELTSDEQAAMIESLTREIAEKTDLINKLSVGVEDEGILAKVNDVLETSDERSVSLADNQDDFVVFRQIAKETLAIIDDTIAILEQNSTIVLDPVEEVASTTTPHSGTSTDVVLDEEETARGTSSTQMEFGEEIQ